MQRPLEIADAVQDAEQVLLVGCTHDQRGGSRAILLPFRDNLFNDPITIV